jgi:hypothetical protein
MRSRDNSGMICEEVKLGDCVYGMGNRPLWLGRKDHLLHKVTPTLSSHSGHLNDAHLSIHFDTFTNMEHAASSYLGMYDPLGPKPYHHFRLLGVSAGHTDMSC